MKTLLLLAALILVAAPAWAGEGGTGLGGPPGTPEPSTIGLLGAAVLFGLPAWRWFRRKAIQEREYESSE